MRDAEVSNAQVLEEHGRALEACEAGWSAHGRALEELRGRVAVVEAQEAVVQELQAGVLELQVGAGVWMGMGAWVWV